VANELFAALRTPTVREGVIDPLPAGRGSPELFAALRTPTVRDEVIDPLPDGCGSPELFAALANPDRKGGGDRPAPLRSRFARTVPWQRG